MSFLKLKIYNTNISKKPINPKLKNCKYNI